MADWLTLVSAFIVVFAFLFLGVFISRLGVLEARAFIGPVFRSTMDIPSKSVVEVRNPFVVQLVEERPLQKGIVSFLLSNTAPCYVTAYWGVSIMSIDNALAKEETTPQDNDNDDNDDTSEESELIQTVPIHRILSGSYESKGPMEYYDPGQEHTFKTHIPIEYESQLEKTSDQQDNQTFPLVVVVERSRNISQQEAVKSCDIVSQITALRCAISSTDTRTLSISNQYIQIANGNIFPLKKLYVSDSDSHQTDIPSSENSTVSSQDPDTTVSTATCIVCHSMPITRVLLPCRHACVCGLCFSKLEGKCPMCREWIQSFFVTSDEPDVSNELETSRELKAMSAGDIITGMFRAS